MTPDEMIYAEKERRAAHWAGERQSGWRRVVGAVVALIWWRW